MRITIVAILLYIGEQSLLTPGFNLPIRNTYYISYCKDRRRCILRNSKISSDIYHSEINSNSNSSSINSFSFTVNVNKNKPENKANSNVNVEEKKTVETKKGFGKLLVNEKSNNDNIENISSKSRSEKKKEYRELLKSAKKTTSLKKMLAGNAEPTSGLKQKKQGHGGW